MRSPTRRRMLAAAPALLGAACTRPRDQLTFWGLGYEGDLAPALLQDFTAATGIAVQSQSLPWTEAQEKLLTAYAGGALPDVFTLPNGWIGEFALLRALRPHGQALAYPWTLAPQAQFYRTDLLRDAGYDAPPQDWAGWRRMGHAIRRRHPDRFAFLLLLNWWDALFTFLAQACTTHPGAPLLRDHNTRGNFRTPQAREAVAFYASLFAEGLAPKVLSTEVEDPVASFAGGWFAVYPSAPTLLTDLRRRAADIPPALWATARMPGPTGPGAVSATSASLAIAATTRRPQAAARLVAFLTSAQAELRLQRLIGNLPASRAAWAQGNLAADPLLAPFAAQLAVAAPDPPVIEWEHIRIEVQRVAEAIVRGNLGLDQGLAEMDRRTDRILAQRRALIDAGRPA